MSGRLLGIDLGDRRIGLAVGDPGSGSVRPLATIRRAPRAELDARTIGTTVAEQGVEELVVGLPLNADGTEGTQAVTTRAWAEAIAAATRIRVTLRDERYTSERAEGLAGRLGRGASGAPPSRARRAAHRARIDREAAVLIVQDELDARARGGEPG